MFQKTLGVNDFYLAGEFGMNWSAYSRLVGNIFGAPLAMEGLAAFFLESTFLGLWLFGWDKLSRRVHLATIWLVAFGSVLSALFIMAANSWMQHPVGYAMVNGKPQLNNIWALFTNPVFVWGYTKVIFAAIVTGAAVMLAVSAWQLRRGGDRAVFTLSARLSLAVLVPAILLAMLVGDELGVIEATYQPMKIAAAEAQWTTCQPCSFSLFQIGGGNQDQTPTQIIAGWSSTRSGRCGKETRSGSSSRERRCSWRSPTGTPPCSPASTWPSSSCCAR